MNAVGGDLVRDVFVVADAMHENAMSQMEGNTPMDEGTQGEGAGGGEAATADGTDGRMESYYNEELDTEGEALLSRCVSHKVVPSSAFVV